MKTTVISVRGRDRAKLLADANFLYVGRRCAGWPDSIWGNPFKPVKGGIDIDWSRVRSEWWSTHETIWMGSPLEQCVTFYHQWVTGSSYLMERLPELRGKVLGCWCATYDGINEPSAPCHAVVLARLADTIAEAV